jgi:transcriptional regulator with XRE-family HTH domain
MADAVGGKGGVWPTATSEYITCDITADMNEVAIARTVRWARKRAGMTQHDLARAVGMPQPSIARIERGTVMPRMKTLLALLEATGHQLAVEPIGPSVGPDAIARRRAMSVPARTWEAIGRAVARNRQKSPLTILRRLRLFAVPFVLVGELAEVAHGSPATVERVVEICHPGTDLARERLRRTLDDLGADPALTGQDFATDAGRLLTMTETDAGDAYDVLIRTAVRMPVDAGVLVRVASLEDLIRIRLARGTEADAEAAAILRAIRDEPPSIV